MNLWDRLRGLALVLIAPLFFTCEDPNEIGTELNPNDDNVNTFFRDFILPTSLILSDSIPTQENENMAFGVYEDPVFGRIKVTPYFQFGVFDSGIGPQLTVSPDAIYDSTVLVLQYSFFHGEDFSALQRMTVHEIADTLFGGVTYNSSVRTAVERDPIGVAEFRATPDADSLQIIRINDEWGQMALDAVRNRPISRFDPVLLFDVPGIALVPDDDMDYIVGVEHEIQASDSVRIEESTTMRIYYHLPSDSTNRLFWDYTLFGENRYMFVESDLSNSVLSGLTETFTEFVPSTDDRYVQPYRGVHTKVDMSPIWDFIDSLNGFVVNKADFEITPVFDRGGTEDNIRTLDQISLMFIGESNRINGATIFNANENINTIILDDGSYVTNQTSNPLRLDYNPELSLYRAEISNYLQAAADEALQRTDLLIFPLRFTTAPRGVVANQIDELIFNRNDLRIRLFYTTIQ